MTIPTPGSVWITHMWEGTGPYSVGFTRQPCLVLAVGPQDDRSNAAGDDVRRCKLLRSNGAVLEMLSSMMEARLL